MNGWMDTLHILLVEAGSPGVLSRLSQLCAPLFEDPANGLLKFVEGVRAIESVFGHDSRSDYFRI